MSGERIDLNADVGEGSGQDPALLHLITSANIACGVHAGDATTMRATVVLARDCGVAAGAHPSFPDREGFGRRELRLSPRELEECVITQVRALAEIAASERVRLRHVKPHGALYNVAARDASVADAIVRAVLAFDPSLILYGLAGSELLEAGKRAGLETASEVFADRGYRSDGTLVPRGEREAVIEEAAIVVPRAIAMVRQRAVTAADGSRVSLQVDTICVHGDTPGAAALAAQIRAGLLDTGIEVAAPG